MVHIVGTLDKVGFISIYAELNFHHHPLPVHQIDENVLGFSVQFVFHFHDPEYLRIEEVNPFDFVVKGDDFALF